MRFLSLLSCLCCAFLICADTCFCDSLGIFNPNEKVDLLLPKKKVFVIAEPEIQQRILIEQRENKDRAILFYRTGGDSSVFMKFAFSIEDGIFIDNSRSSIEEYNLDNDVILQSSKSIEQPWMVGEGYENHIQLVPVEKRNYLVKDYKIFDADCPVFIRLQDGVCVFRCKAGPWSIDHLKAMWKESIKPRRQPAIQCAK